MCWVPLRVLFGEKNCLLFVLCIFITGLVCPGSFDVSLAYARNASLAMSWLCPELFQLFVVNVFDLLMNMKPWRAVCFREHAENSFNVFPAWTLPTVTYCYPAYPNTCTILTLDNRYEILSYSKRCLTAAFYCCCFLNWTTFPEPFQISPVSHTLKPLDFWSRFFSHCTDTMVQLSYHKN